MTTLTYLEVDLTGLNPANQFQGELQKLVKVPNRKNRVTTTSHGMFYEDSLSVRQADGTPVTKSDYEVTYLHPILSELTGQPVKAMIVITNPSIPDLIRISYQAVGLNGGLEVDALRRAMELLAEDKINFTLDDIIGKPDAYVPAPHENKWWQVYGLETMIENIDRISTLWPYGTKAIIDENQSYGIHWVGKIDALIDNYRLAVMRHLNDFDNPHNTTKHQLGLGNLNDWAFATASKITNNVNNQYLPIGGVYLQLNKVLIPEFHAHLRDFSNPHELTLAMLGLYSYGEIDTLFTRKLKRGTQAHSSKLLAGADNQHLYTQTRINLDVSNIQPNTVFNRNRLGNPHPTWVNGFQDYALVGTNQFRDIRELFSDIGLGDATWVYIPGTHGSWSSAWNSIVGRAAPAGTYIFAKYVFSAGDLNVVIDIAVGQRNADGTTRSIN